MLPTSSICYRAQKANVFLVSNVTRLERYFLIRRMSDETAGAPVWDKTLTQAPAQYADRLELALRLFFFYWSVSRLQFILFTRAEHFLAQGLNRDSLTPTLTDLP